jgi:hypothetical protein
MQRSGASGGSLLTSRKQAGRVQELHLCHLSRLMHSQFGRHFRSNDLFNSIYATFTFSFTFALVNYCICLLACSWKPSANPSFSFSGLPECPPLKGRSMPEKCRCNRRFREKKKTLPFLLLPPIECPLMTSRMSQLNQIKCFMLPSFHRRRHRTDYSLGCVTYVYM